MRSDAYITVTCDNCGAEENLQLTATARGGSDERNVDSTLKGMGWSVENGDLCEGCKGEEEEEPQ